jgi:hypothetical protein
MRSIAYLQNARDEDGVKGRGAPAAGRLPLTPPQSRAFCHHAFAVTSCLNRVFALEAHRLKSVDGSQSVLRGRVALAAIHAITVCGQLSPGSCSTTRLRGA